MIKNTLFLFFICAAVFVFYLPSYLKMQDLHERNEAYRHKIADLEAENTRLMQEQDRLENDPEYFERMARDKMGLIKDGEAIYKLVPQGQKTRVEPEVKTSSPKNKSSVTIPKSSKKKKTATVNSTKAAVK